MKENPTVLAVDDERVIRELIEAALSQQGYPVLTAESGEEALSILQQEKINFVLLDIKMPGMDGLQVLEQIHLDYPDIIVVMMSGVDEEDIAQLTLRMGASEYICKPFDLEYVGALIDMLEILEG